MRKTAMVAAAAALLVVFPGCGGSSGPDAPTGLTVTGTSPITLSWDGVSGATGYDVYRGTASGGLSTKTRLARDVPATAYTDPSAIAGTTYYYQVTAVNSDGVSGGSNEVHAAYGSQGGSFVLGGAKGSSGIVLNWSGVAGAARYNVYRGTVSAVITNKAKVASGIVTTTWTDADVLSGHTYYYEVTAVDGNGIETEVTNETAVTF